MNKRLTNLVLNYLKDEYRKSHPPFVVQLNDAALNRLASYYMDREADLATSRNRAKRARKVTK